MKRSGQARLVYVKDVNRNIPTTWRWARGNRYVYMKKEEKGEEEKKEAEGVDEEED